MVPKVNSGANVYGVLQYNRIKVEAGEGRILYMQGIDGRFSIEECAEAFGYYTALNPRVRKPVVHFSLNPSPEDRLSEAQLTRLAAEFMERMGYGRQPYVVFLHEDIARRHMHVVSVRVDEQGRKIDHNNELRRAMAVCRELEHEYGLHVPEDGGVQTEPEELHRVDYLRSDLKHQLRNVVMTLKQQYGFQSLAEFNTLLERYGLAAEEVRGDVRGRPYRGSFTTCSMTTGSAREPRSKRPGWAISSDGRRWKKNSTPRNNGFGNIPKRSTVHAAKSTVPGAEAATARSSQPNFGKRYRRSFPGERCRADLRSHFHRPHDTSGVQRLPARKGVCGRRFRGVVQRSGARVVHTHTGRVTAVGTPRTAPAGTIFGRRVRGVHRDPLRFDARRNRRTHGI